MSRRHAFALIAGSLLLLFAQGLLHRSVLDRTVGATGWTSWLFGLPGGQSPRKLNTLLLRSAMSAQLSPGHPEYYFSLADQWEVALKEAGVAFQTITDGELKTGLNDLPGVLILPRAVCLGEEHRAAIARYVEAGNGLVISGALGARNEDCTWRGFGYLSQLTGLESPESASSGVQTRAAFRGEEYYSAFLPPGYLLPLPPGDLTLGEYPDPDASWTDWRMRPEGGPDATVKTLALHRTRGAGRLVWFGFTETLVGASKEDRRLLDRFMSSAAMWSARQPLAAVGAWPKHNPAAAMLAFELEPEKYKNEELARFFRRAGVRPTFMVDTTAAMKSQAILGPLLSSGEVGAAYAETGENTPLEVARAMRSIAGMNRGYAQFAGFATPATQAQDFNLATAGDAGYLYYFDPRASAVFPSVAWSRRPTFLNWSSREMVRLPDHNTDDFEILADFPSSELITPKIGPRFLHELNLAQNMHGLCVFRVHDDLLGAPGNRQALREILGQVRKERVWFTTASSIARWTVKRENLIPEARTVSGSRIQVSLTNRGRSAVEDVSLFVYLPGGIRNIKMIPVVLGRGLPRIIDLGRDDGIRLDFDYLPAQGSIIVLLSLV
jgi:hypothetical protein